VSELQNKVALVTGASQGIGRAIALRLARAGAGIALVAMNDSHLGNTFQEMKDMGVRVLRYGVDLTDDHELEQMAHEVLGDWGSIDILVNNAGIGGPTAPIHEMPVEGWDRTLAINLRAPFLLSRILAPGMIKQKGGKIINMSSIAGKMAYPLRTPYAASKWALIGLTLTVAQELGSSNIQVNAICPGPTETELIESVIRARAEAVGTDYETMSKEYVKATALKRMVQPEEVADLVHFLCSPAASAITGQAIDISAGYGFRIGD
jgi:NAD(P)-dependent dehydrogenase (short-subunit alcohol dehydrogenase family)